MLLFGDTRNQQSLEFREDFEDEVFYHSDTNFNFAFTFKSLGTDSDIVDYAGYLQVEAILGKSGNEDSNLEFFNIH